MKHNDRIHWITFALAYTLSTVALFGGSYWAASNIMAHAVYVLPLVMFTAGGVFHGCMLAWSIRNAWRAK